jgi:hypothetical protein
MRASQVQKDSMDLGLLSGDREAISHPRLTHELSPVACPGRRLCEQA